MEDENLASIGDESPPEESQSGGITEAKFNKARASHEVSKERLKIAKCTIIGVGFLLLVCLVTLWCIPFPQRSEILETLILSLFNLATLVIGFVAGSSIDNK